jgi:hypothetical protein
VKRAGDSRSSHRRRDKDEDQFKGLPCAEATEVKLNRWRAIVKPTYQSKEHYRKMPARTREAIERAASAAGPALCTELGITAEPIAARVAKILGKE